MPIPSYPKFKRRRAQRYIPVGTRLLRIGDDLRTQLSAGPLEASPAERAVYGWLIRFDVPFIFQQPLMGGRRIPGGAVVDFLIPFNPSIVIRVQSYWHTNAEQVEVDVVQEMVLEEEGFVVEDIWEWETTDWRTLSARLEEILFGYRPVYGAPIVKEAYVPPHPDCPYSFETICFGIDC